MAYRIRFLTESRKRIPLKTLEEDLRKRGLDVRFAVEGGEPARWDRLLLSHLDGTMIAFIDYDPVKRGSASEGTIQEFLEDIEAGKPVSAREWLREYLPTVRTIYPIQILPGADVRGGWDAVYCIRDTLMDQLIGIMHADMEGFSNLDGLHILWQFSDNVSGPWNMALLQDDEWVWFEMDLGNPEHREAFLRGEVPPGIEASEY
jgi:hypothetical protein